MDWNNEEYIFDVVGYYKSKVCSWDVINEVINDNGEVYEKMEVRKICRWKISE